MQSLKSKRDFAQLMREGRRIKLTSWLSFCWLRDREPEQHLGFVLPRRFGKAVTRNRARRVYRAAMREGLQQCDTQFKGAFVFRSTPSDFESRRELTFHQATNHVGRILHQMSSKQ